MLIRSQIVLFGLYLWCRSLGLGAAADDGQSEKKNRPKKIAVIGGGISGSFVTKYLADYDVLCEKIDSITIFEANPIVGPVRSKDFNSDSSLIPDPSNIQGSRVTSLQLESDGTIVELGASIGYKGFYHVIEMINGDESLERTEPFSTSVEAEGGETDEEIRNGVAVYGGRGWWPLVTAGLSERSKRLTFGLRYFWDFYKIQTALTDFLSKWSNLPTLLKSSEPISFFDSPDEIWKSIGLINSVNLSFDQLLDRLRITSETSFLGRFLPQYGAMRKELLAAINLVNYNQNNSEVNGIVGMGSFAASMGGLFSIKGGNYKVIQSALKQARSNRHNNCKSGTESIQEVTKRITAVLGRLEGFTLYSDQEVIGDYDIVILAAPLQHSKISFLIHSNFDAAVIQPMPLGGLINAHNEDVHTDGGRATLPEPLPGSATRPYKQVTTTVVSNANLSIEFLSFKESTHLPRSIMTTDAGKYELHNITSITFIKVGLYKMFSDEPLDVSILTKLFGPVCKVEYVKVWGGTAGGATPDYQGQGKSPGFLLYDGAAGMEGHTTSGALYYPNAMEQSSLASMEVAAVGAKAVAKLIAQRLKMFHGIEKQLEHDEL